MYVEGLVLDEEVARVTLDGVSHHDGPRLNDTPLVVGRFDAVEAQELVDDGVNAFRVTSSHNFQLSILNPSSLHVENLVIALRTLQNFVQVFAVGVGDEDLSESIAGHQVHYLLHTLGIEFVEDVVQQE